MIEDKESMIKSKTKEINRLLIQKREIAVFIGRDNTSDSQRLAFTRTYADYEGKILQLQGQIRRLES